MLVNLVEILKTAEENKCAVGAFNTPNLECIHAVLHAAVVDQKIGRVGFDAAGHQHGQAKEDRHRDRPGAAVRVPFHAVDHRFHRRSGRGWRLDSAPRLTL